MSAYRSISRPLAGLIAIVLLMISVAVAEAANRVALVIGMSKYQTIPQLANATNDATASWGMCRRTSILHQARSSFRNERASRRPPVCWSNSFRA